jgi:hypothetical protein
MEASMRGPCDESGETIENGFFQRWGAGFLVLPILLLITLIGLAIVQPATSNWIADAVMAEVPGANYSPDAAPTQFAKAIR